VQRAVATSTFVIDGHHELMAYQRLGWPCTLVHIHQNLRKRNEIDASAEQFAALADRLRPEHRAMLAPFRP